MDVHLDLVSLKILEFWVNIFNFRSVAMGNLKRRGKIIMDNRGGDN